MWSLLVTPAPPCIILFMDPTRVMMMCGRFFSHSSLMASNIFSLLVGFLERLLRRFLRIAQLCSVVLRSGELAIHNNFRALYLVLHHFESLLLWIDALSSMRKLFFSSAINLFNLVSFTVSINPCPFLLLPSTMTNLDLLSPAIARHTLTLDRPLRRDGWIFSDRYFSS